MPRKTVKAKADVLFLNVHPHIKIFNISVDNVSLSCNNDATSCSCSVWEIMLTLQRALMSSKPSYCSGSRIQAGLGCTFWSSGVALIFQCILVVGFTSISIAYKGDRDAKLLSFLAGHLLWCKPTVRWCTGIILIRISMARLTRTQKTHNMKRLDSSMFHQFFGG